MVDLKPMSPKQLRSIREGNARINVWEGSVRSGKTFSSILRWLVFLDEMPKGNLLMVGKTGRSLENNVLSLIAEMVGQGNCRINRGLGEAYICGRKVLLSSANDLRSEQKIRGLTLAGAYCDEVTLYPESYFKMLLSRLSVAGAKLFGTCNPDSPYHYLKREYLDRAGDLDLARFSFVLDDNPALDQAFVAALKQEYTGLWYRRMIDGEWVVAQGAVYDMWDESVHTYEALPPDVVPFRKFVGVDYGTANPCVFLYAVEDTLGRGWIEDEYYWDSSAKGRQKTDDEYADDLERFIEGRDVTCVVCDPSAASFITALKRRKIRVKAADNAVVSGIRTVSSALKNGRLRVNRGRCPNLIREVTSYVWDDNAQLRGEDAPLKQNDHAVDALRYLYTTAIGKGRDRGVSSF